MRGNSSFDLLNSGMIPHQLRRISDARVGSCESRFPDAISQTPTRVFLVVVFRTKEPKCSRMGRDQQEHSRHLDECDCELKGV
jgi:hypothetical protein